MLEESKMTLKNQVAEQLSLFGLKETEHMRRQARVTDFHEIAEPPKEFIRYGKDKHD
jgi:hypothetical protein